MLGRIKLSSLIAVAGGAGIALGGMSLLLSQESTRFADQARFVKTALDLVEKEPEIIEMIGQPYSLGQAKVMDLWLKYDTNNVKVKIPVKGLNDTGSIYVFARKKDRNEKLKLFKIEMTFDKILGKKLVIFDVEDEDGSDIDSAPEEPKVVDKKKPETKKNSPIPDGMIPEISPKEKRRIPRLILDRRQSKATDSKTNGGDVNCPDPS